jgi:hypothetical protein
VQQKPGDGSTHWSCRKLANQLGLSKSTVQRILAQAQLKPHRLERYMASNDPDFEAKAADIIALYLTLSAESDGLLVHWGELQIRPVGKDDDGQNDNPDDDLRYPGHN